nr:hypothetical protein Iba_chr10aCG17190 [Ipomoea batatas]GME18122.1 hypothetical protein Iba_scaffold19979CG0090 [Ipomoea batatas]
MRCSWSLVNFEKSSYNILTHFTLVGAFSNAILALVMIPNWPNPPKTAKNSSEFMSLEQVINSPFPVMTSSSRTLLICGPHRNI